MDILSKRPEIEDVLQRGLLRTVAGSDILQGFGSVFRKDMHLDEDVSTQAFEVDIFVSHSWSSDGWPKYLALCRVLNLGKALEAVALILVMIFLAASCRGIGPRSGYDRDTIFFVAVSWLVVLGIFFQVLFLGQHATCGERKPTLWLDRLCIEQTDARQKASGIAALPVFVARSSQFLMLYDESYLDRLWCIVELATFVKKSGCEPVHFVPLWLPRWLLTTMLLDILQGCVCIAALLVWSWSSPQELSPLASGRGLNHFLNNLLLVLILLPGYIVVLAPSMWALGQKAQGHEEMLQQFAAFDIRRCKCSDPSDRQPLETLVNELFASNVSAGGSAVCSVSEASATSKEVTSLSEAEEEEFSSLLFRCSSGSEEDGPLVQPTVELSHDSGLDAFNAYVQGDLRAALMDKLGDQTFLSYGTCFVAFLPGSSFFLLNTLAVDGVHSVAFDFPHGPPKWALCAAEVVIMSLLVTPALLPTLLQLTHRVYLVTDPGFCQSFVAALGGFLVSTLMIFLGFATLGALEAMVLTRSRRWLVVFVFLMSLILANFCFHFMHSEVRRLRRRSRQLMRSGSE